MTNWPQYTYLALMLIRFGSVWAEHGKPRGPHNAWASFITSALILLLLWQGGFFKGLL